MQYQHIRMIRLSDQQHTFVLEYIHTPSLNNRVCHMKGSKGVVLAVDSHKLTETIFLVLQVPWFNLLDDMASTVAPLLVCHFCHPLNRFATFSLG